MTDAYGREITYMRVSVTDRCDLRCVYCMPESGVQKCGRDQTLRTEEFWQIIRAAAALGITKIRITGGEPLVRKGIVELCRGVADIPGIRELGMTTNGQLLEAFAGELRHAGVNRLNISIDTMKPDRFKKITRIGDIEKTLRGIRAAAEAGFDSIKLNVVLMKGMNDDEIRDFVALTLRYPVDVRFIELMPIGESVRYWEHAYLSNDAVLGLVPELETEYPELDGVSRMFRLGGALGRVGLINPISSHFCGECNKIRLTSDGKIKPCLHSSHEYTLRGLEDAELQKVLADAISLKPMKHNAYSKRNPSESQRNMHRIGG